MQIENNVRDFMVKCDAIINYQYTVPQGYVFDSLESPIERLFYLALKTVAVYNGIPFERMVEIPTGDREDERERERQMGCFYHGIEIHPQHHVGPYRADFLIIIHCGVDHGSVVVECDGHKFHEMTEKARRAEKKRDRYMQIEKNLKVLRFTGAEIVSEPFRVALDVVCAILPNAARLNIFSSPDA